MGTSQSSSGSPSGVPMVPPWVPDIPLPDPAPEGPPSEEEPEDGEAPAPSPRPEPRQPIPIAPGGRFGNARRALGSYAQSGDRDSMRQGIGRYIKSGYSGSPTATSRFGATAQTANALNAALSGGVGQPHAAPSDELDPVLMAGRSAEEVMDAVVEAVRPVDGTQDTEASRTAIKDALSEVLTRFPEADLLDLQEEHREFAIERYVAVDVFLRFELDLGRTILDKAPDHTTALGRLKEIREYIKETVAASFRRLRESGRQMATSPITQIVQSALRETFQVFEGYAE